MLNLKFFVAAIVAVIVHATTAGQFPPLPSFDGESV